MAITYLLVCNQYRLESGKVQELAKHLGNVSTKVVEQMAVEGLISETHITKGLHVLREAINGLGLLNNGRRLNNGCRGLHNHRLLNRLLLNEVRNSFCGLLSFWLLLSGLEFRLLTCNLYIDSELAEKGAEHLLKLLRVALFGINRAVENLVTVAILERLETVALPVLRSLNLGEGMLAMFGAHFFGVVASATEVKIGTIVALEAIPDNAALIAAITTDAPVTYHILLLVWCIMIMPSSTAGALRSFDLSEGMLAMLGTHFLRVEAFGAKVKIGTIVALKTIPDNGFLLAAVANNAEVTSCKTVPTRSSEVAGLGSFGDLRKS